MTRDFSYQLGKAPARVDPRTLRLENYIEAGFPTPPPSIDNSQRVGAWGTLGNDQYGDCVVAAYAHLLMLWSALAGEGTWAVSPQEVIQLYLQRTGGIDSGLVELDFLRWAIKNFWKGRELLGFASVDPRNATLMEHGISMFGAVFRGILLPRTAQGQIGTLWRFLPGVNGNQPGSWGGHATIGLAYDHGSQLTKDITWGMIQQATYDFWARYQDENYVIIPDKPIPGFNTDGFIRDLQAIGQYYGPSPSPTPPAPPTPTPPAPPSPIVVYASRFDGVATYSDGKKQTFSISGLLPARSPSFLKRFLGLFG